MNTSSARGYGHPTRLIAGALWLAMLVAPDARVSGQGLDPGCGDGAVAADEECDDGNAVGGDGCAANCTSETLRPFLLDPSASSLTIQLQSFPITVSLDGQLGLTLGRRRATDPHGVVPLVARVADYSFTPVRVLGLVCMCVRGVETPAYGPGNAAQGTVGCGVEGLAGIDYATVLDGGATSTTFGGSGPAGSMLLHQRLSTTFLQDGGLCSSSGQACAADYGPDCLPCTDDDARAPMVTAAAFTTGVASATIRDADGVPGADIAPGANCFGSPCVAQAQGAPFSCSEIEAASSIGTGQLAAAYPFIDATDPGDAVVTIRLAPMREPSAQFLFLERGRLHAGASSGLLGGRLDLHGAADATISWVDDIGTAGVGIDVATSPGRRLALTWSAVQCSVRVVARGPVIRCTAGDVGSRRRLLLRPTAAAGIMRLDVRARGLAIDAPLDAEPIDVRLSTAATPRLAVLGGCSVHGRRDQMKTCR